MKPLPSPQVLDRYFLDARSRLLDVAAFLDRIDRGNNTSAVADDPRLEKLWQALEIMHDGSSDRAQRILRLFSIDYDPTWERPKPR